MRLTKQLLKRIIEEEVGKFGDMEDVESVAKDTEETDADEYADSLEKKIDYVKALKIEENRLRRRLAMVEQTKHKTLKSIVRSK